MTTILAAGPDGTFEISGQIVVLPIGDRRVRFLIEKTEAGTVGSLTHVASGRAFHKHLRAFAIEHLVRHGTMHRRPNNRELAEACVAAAIDRLGVETILATLDAAPVVNGRGRAA